MAGTPRVHTLPLWKQWQYTSGTWLPASLIALLVIGLVACVYLVVPLREAADVRGAATHHAGSIVSAVSYLPAGKGTLNPSVLVSLTVAGEVVMFRSRADLHKGEAVQVTYRVGKSGHVRIDDIEPERKAER